MLHRIVSIYDLKAQVYSKPIFVPNTGSAIRAWGDAINAKDSPNEYTRHPEDYIMFDLGEYDDTTGAINSSLPVELARALALVST